MKKKAARRSIDGMSPKQFLKYVKSLPETDPELDAELTRQVLSRPDMAVRAIKTLREMSVNPAISASLRRKIVKDLKQRGFDDESLKREDQ